MNNPLLTLFTFVAAGSIAQAQDTGATVKHDIGTKTIRVDLNGKLFTEFRYNQEKKPILYPIIGPHGIEMTRNYPMKKEVPGEAADHPHHTSLWFTHGNVNDSDFWANGEEKIVTKEIVRADKDGTSVVIESKNDWIAKDGKPVCSDTTTITLGEANGDRFIDYLVTVHASAGDVTFKDTKEGTMGIRTNPALRLKGDVAAGSAINSEGDKDGELWGKNAKWVDYWAKINGNDVGIAIFDHTTNLRHPTTWHARDYGLIAANPFGIHDFQKLEKGTGDFTLKSGESQTFHYYFLFHEGDHAAADIPEKYDAWISGKK
ncbi:MAG: PmoA family protein [Verrucomicrobiales bacterium]